jgi:hypothetical protein
LIQGSVSHYAKYNTAGKHAKLKAKREPKETEGVKDITVGEEKERNARQIN